MIDLHKRSAESSTNSDADPGTHAAGSIGDAARSSTLSTASAVLIRPPRPDDRAEFVAQMRASEHLHRPWIFPPTSMTAYDDYLRRIERDDHLGFLVCEQSSGRLAGVININNIVHNAFLSASLGYYAVAALGGRGYMQAGLRLVTAHAFRNLHLHRLEANIQPANERSKALVRATGFRLEGLSPAYLFIDGAWRDHERWTLVDHRKGLY